MTMLQYSVLSYCIFDVQDNADLIIMKMRAFSADTTVANAYYAAILQ